MDAGPTHDYRSVSGTWRDEGRSAEIECFLGLNERCLLPL